MERLTESKENYYGEQQKIRQLCYMGFDGDCKYPSCAGCAILKLYRKLAEYEDLNLEPEQVQNAYNICVENLDNFEQLFSESIELKKHKDLEEQDRLIELPCKVGDIVYWPSPFKTGINSGEICAIKMSKFGFDLEVKTTTNIIWREFEKVFLAKEDAEKAIENHD